MAVHAVPHPVQVELESDLRIARWRPFVHWLLAVPHYLVWYALGLVQGVLTFLAFFAILFTRRMPQGIYNTLVMTYRYEWRVSSYVLCLREAYPPFDFSSVAVDPGDDPARLSVERPEQLRRFLPLIKWLLAFPHYLVLVVLGLVAFVAALAGCLAVIVTRRYPASLCAFQVGFTRWNMRVQAYTGLLIDRYPPFRLSR